MTHTPGPWNYARGEIYAHNKSIATINSWDMPVDEAARNAILIVAAPELLTALREIETWLLRTDAPGGQAALRRARAAIAKTEDAP